MAYMMMRGEGRGARGELKAVRLARLLVFLLFSSLVPYPSSLVAQPAVKSFITVRDMVIANPFQVADPTAGGGRTATVMVQETAAAYALTNTWSGTNTGTLIASSTPDWAWALLPLASGPNFYNSDGTLTGPRTVDLGTRSLLWRGPGSITSSNVSSYLVYASGNVGLNGASDVSLSAGQRLLLRTPYVANANPGIRTGDVLMLSNAGTGESEFKPIPSQVTLYTGDGSLSTNRTVTLGGNSLTFKGPGPAAFNSVDSFSVLANQFATISSPGNVILESGTGGLLSLRTPNVVGGGAQQGQVLTLTGPNGVVEFTTPLSSGGSNIYNTDGVITANRVVDTTNRILLFKGPGTFAVSNSVTDLRGATAQLVGNIASIIATNELRLQTPFVRNASAATGQVLTLLDAATGRVEYQTPASLPTLNIYNSDGTLSGDRTVSGGSTRTLNFTNNVKLTASAATLLLRGSQSLQLVTPGVANLTADLYQVPTLINTNNGQVEFLAVPNIYTKDGNLLTNRIVDGRSHDLSFTNVAHLDQRAWTNTVAGTQKFELITPTVNSGAAATNMVLTLLDRTTGRSDWQWPAVTSSVNIYNSDGTISTANGTRAVNLDTNTLYFNGSLGTFFVNSVGRVNVIGRTNHLYAQNQWIGGVVGPSPGIVALATARTVGGTAGNGQVLTLMDAPGSVVEYAPAFNLYNSNGVVSGNRIIEANFRDLMITNANVFDLRGRTSVLSGQLELDVRTPNVVSGTSATNRVLTLLDATSGRSEFMPPAAAPFDVSIYTTNGTLTGDRILTTGPRLLTIQATGGGNVDLINYNQARFYGLTNDIYGQNLASIATSGALRIRPVNVGSAALGDVVMMVGTLGEVEYRSLTNIYRRDGTLLGNRIVTGANFDLSFTNNRVFALSSVTNTIKSTGGLKLETPVISGGSASVGWIMTLKDRLTGEADWAAINAPTGSVNIYNSDGTLTGNRLLGMAGRDLIFDGNGGASRLITQNMNYSLLSATDFILYSPYRIIASAATNEVEATVAMRLKTPRVRSAAAKAGDVLVFDGVNVDFQTLVNTPVQDTSIYKDNGIITGNRTLSGTNLYSLGFSALTDFTVSAGTMTLLAPNRLSLRTPGFATRQGQFLKLVNQTDGTVEFDVPPTNNLYNTDGTLTGNRVVTQGASNLTFNGTGNFTVSGQGQQIFSGINTTINGSTQLHLESAGRIDLATPNVRNSTAQAGQVLTLMDPDIGRVEYATPTADTSIYKNDGAIGPGPRTLNLNNQTLRFQGFGNVEHNALGTYDVTAITRAKLQSSGEMEIGGQTQLRIRTPGVQNSSAQLGQVLTLTGTNGTVEFQAAPTAVAQTYLSDLVDTGTGVSPSTLWFGIQPNMNPPYGGPLPEAPTGTRLTGRLRRPNAAGGWANTGSGGVSLNFPINPASGGDHTYERGILDPHGSELAPNTLYEGVVVDLVFVREWNGPSTPGKWIMLNSGYKGTTFAATDVSAGLSFTNTVTRNISAATFAGVVDTASDLPYAPLAFKKISTLGSVSVGDGLHADFYLANYDPNAPIADIVRSSVDLNKMWRKLK
jgi:hypothetical protein